MDDQVFHLLNSKFDEIRGDLHGINESIKAHVEKDEIYWRKMDVQEAQLSMLRRTILGVVAAITTLISAVWAWLGK
jgi:ABC-type transport system involved in cytochrome bd biosynthesis fused ATPase/permease subunit